MEALLVLAGMFIGVGLTIIFLVNKNVGTLRVDHSDPTEGPYLFAELNKPIGAFCKARYVVMQVKVENFISRR